MFGFRKRAHANRALGISSTEKQVPAPVAEPKHQVLSETPKLRPEIELNLIEELLEQKFHTPFERRVRLDGYIDEPRYRLVLENYKTAHSDNMIGIYGGESGSVLDLHEKFVEKYWADFDRFAGKEPPAPHSFERRTYDDWQRSAVAGSREEFLLQAQVRGLI